MGVIPSPHCHAQVTKEVIVSKVTDSVEEARSDAQALHKKIRGTTEKNHAAIRASARSIAAEASELSSAVNGLLVSQRADAKQHLKGAATSLEAAATDAQDLVNASDADLRARNTALLGRVRSATQKLSQAVATKRASLVKS
jgi:hypothetical protein